jgi:hypothetical protein
MKKKFQISCLGAFTKLLIRFLVLADQLFNCMHAALLQLPILAAPSLGCPLCGEMLAARVVTDQEPEDFDS